MDSRQRVLAAVKRQGADRLATGLRCTAEAWAKLRDYLGAATNQAVLDTLDIDLRWVGLKYIGPKERATATLAEPGVDFWGCRTREVKNEFNTYYEFDYHPLAEMKTVAEVEAYDWPSLDWWDYDGLATTIDEVNQAGRRCILFFAGGAFETPWYLRGLERFLMDLYERPDMVAAICGKVGWYYRQRALRAIAATGGRIDMVGTGGDIGTQRGMMLRPEIWREQIKPHTGGLIKTFHEMGLATFYHSCGSLVPVIDDLIASGLDVLDPIQVTAAGMKPEELYPQFGDRLTFHGAIDEVELLPHATAAEVYAETQRIMKILGGRNGFIVAQSHQVQGDTPPENVAAIYDAVKRKRE